MRHAWVRVLTRTQALICGRWLFLSLSLARARERERLQGVRLIVCPGPEARQRVGSFSRSLSRARDRASRLPCQACKRLLSPSDVTII